MNKNNKHIKHVCRIKRNVNHTGLPPLQPNRNCFQKCARFMRKLLMLNISNAQNRDFFRNTSTMRQVMRRHSTGPHFYIVHPFSVMNLILETVFIVVMIMRLYLLAYHIRKIRTELDIGIDVMWLVLMSSFFLRGYADNHTKTIYIAPKQICIHYLITYFIFDVVIFACHYIMFLIEDDISVILTYVFMFISYMVRFKSLLSVLESLMNYMAFKKMSFIIYHTTLISGIIHLLTCLVLTKPSMVVAIEAYQSMPKSAMDMGDWYVGSFSIVVYHFFGAFFAPTDIVTSEENPIANFYIFVILLIGRICTLILIARVLEYFGYTNMSSSSYEQKMQQLLSFVRYKELPPQLKRRIILHFQSQYNGEYFDERRIMGSLSESLRADIFLYSARKLIVRHEVLRNLPVYVLNTFLSLMNHRIYLTADVVVASGAIIDQVYFIASGTLAGYNASGEEIMHLEEGNEVGMTSWLIYHSNRSILSWIAVETTELYTISREDMKVFFDGQPEVAKYFETRMKERATQYKYRSGGASGYGKKSVFQDLQRGVLLTKPRLRLFGYE